METWIDISYYRNHHKTGYSLPLTEKYNIALIYN